MGIVDDYINELEGKDNIDPLEVASNLLELHNQEIATREAKISELNTAIADKDSELSVHEKEIEKWKAKNFDLVMQVPGADPIVKEESNDNSAITIDDLFKGK